METTKPIKICQHCFRAGTKGELNYKPGWHCRGKGDRDCRCACGAHGRQITFTVRVRAYTRPVRRYVKWVGYREGLGWTPWKAVGRFDSWEEARKVASKLSETALKQAHCFYRGQLIEKRPRICDCFHLDTDHELGDDQAPCQRCSCINPIWIYPQVEAA